MKYYHETANEPEAITILKNGTVVKHYPDPTTNSDLWHGHNFLPKCKINYQSELDKALRAHIVRELGDTQAREVWTILYTASQNQNEADRFFQAEWPWPDKREKGWVRPIKIIDLPKFKAFLNNPERRYLLPRERTALLNFINRALHIFSK